MSDLRLPAEWEPQSGVLLTWPHHHSDWSPVVAQVEPVYVAMTHAIARRQRTIVLCYDDAHRLHVEAMVRDTTGNVACVAVATNDTWIRDYGPITVYAGAAPRLLDFRFNAWGGKFPHELDDRANTGLQCAGLLGTAPLMHVDMVLEGGSIECDGAGTVLTTARCLLSARRNPGLDRDAITLQLQRWLGVRRVLWLEHGGLAGDDNDGHIDILARFCDPHTIAYTRCDDPHDENYPELAAMEDELRRLRTMSGVPYRLVPLPWPAPRFGPDGRRLPAPYANFLVVNGAVLLPVYGDGADDGARRTLERCFPGREVVPIDCSALIGQGGSLHCATMQLPRGVLN